MCGRYSLAAPGPAAIRERFALGAAVAVEQRFNVAPGQYGLAVTTDRDGAPRADHLRWGLVPHWAADPKIGWRMINARAETVSERPAFREPLERRRCLILADGFFEWQRLGPKQKQPWWITRDDRAPFAFAGLWASWRPSGSSADVEPLRTFTILTTQATAALADVHDRMPVMLPREAEGLWLDHEAPLEAVEALCQPFPDTTRVAVGPLVSSPDNDTPAVIEPVTPVGPSAPTLF